MYYIDQYFEINGYYSYTAQQLNKQEYKKLLSQDKYILCKIKRGIEGTHSNVLKSFEFENVPKQSEYNLPQLANLLNNHRFILKEKEEYRTTTKKTIKSFNPGSMTRTSYSLF